MLLVGSFASNIGTNSGVGSSSSDIAVGEDNLPTCLKGSTLYNPTGIFPLDELKGASKNNPSDLLHQQFVALRSKYHDSDLTVDFTTIRHQRPGQKFQMQMTAKYEITKMGESSTPFTNVGQVAFEVEYDFGVKETINFHGQEACQDVKIGRRFWHIRKVTLLSK